MAAFHIFDSELISASLKVDGIASSTTGSAYATTISVVSQPGFLVFLLGLVSLHLLRDLRLHHGSLIKSDIPAEKKLHVRWIPNLEPLGSSLEANEHFYLCPWVQLVFSNMVVGWTSEDP